MDRILIVKTSALGDVVHTFDSLSFLRSLYPKSEISWVVEKGFAPLVRSHPDIDHVIEVETKKWRKNPFSKEVKTFKASARLKTYDLIFDFQGNLKSGLILNAFQGTRKIGFSRKCVPEKWNLFFTNETYFVQREGDIRQTYLSLVEQALGKKAPAAKGICLKATDEEQRQVKGVIEGIEGPLVVASFGSAWENKVASFSTYVLFLQMLAKKYGYFALLIYGSEKEKKQAQFIEKNLHGRAKVVDRLSFAALQRLIFEADLFVGMDSFPLHLAATTGTPTFSFFGPSSERVYAPKTPRSQSVQGTCPYGINFKTRCKKLRTCKTGACIKNLSFEKLEETFSKSPCS